MSLKNISEVIGGVGIPVLTELPDANPEKAGQVFIMQDTGRRWVYNDGRWAGLPVGEPWPEVGYKEVSFVFQLTSTTATIIKVNAMDYAATITPSKVDATTGTYRFQFDIGSINIVSIDRFLSGPTAFGGSSGAEYYNAIFSLDPGTDNKLRIQIFSRLLDGTLVNVSSANSGTVGFREYPPTN